MESKQKTRGSWEINFIILLSAIFGVLLYWAMGFIAESIGVTKGPVYSDIRAKYVGEEMLSSMHALNKEIYDLNCLAISLMKQQGNMRNNTNSLQNTVNRLLLLQKDSLEKGVEFSEKNKQTLRESQDALLESQKKNEQYDQDVAQLKQEQRQKLDELDSVQQKIIERDKQVNEEMKHLNEQHRLKLAEAKLGFLVPAFMAVSWLFMKHRSGKYRPIIWTAFLAIFITIAMIIYGYFPSRYFKYIAVALVTGIVLWILLYQVRKEYIENKECFFKTIILALVSTYLGALAVILILHWPENEVSVLNAINGFLIIVSCFPMGLAYCIAKDMNPWFGLFWSYLLYLFLLVLALVFRGKKAFLTILIIWIILLLLNVHGCVDGLSVKDLH